MSRMSVLLLAVLLLGVVAGCAQATPVPLPTLKPVRMMTLTCADCEASGIAPNIWKDEAMTTVICRARWGERAAVLVNAGDMIRIRTDSGCNGWIRKTLLR